MPRKKKEPTKPIPAIEYVAPTPKPKKKRVTRKRTSVDERIAISEKVCDLYSTGDYTLESCCAAVGVLVGTFSNWAAPSVVNFNQLDLGEQKILLRRGYVQYVHDLFKKAKGLGDLNFKELLKNESRSSLLKRVKGYSYDETHYKETTDAKGKLIAKEEKIVTKKVLPDVTATIFALKNVDSQNFSDTKRIEGVIGVVGMYDDMSLEEMDKEDAVVKKQLQAATKRKVRKQKEQEN